MFPNKDEEDQQYTDKEPPKSPTLEQLMKPEESLPEGEVMMYVRDPETGDYKPHLIAKALPQPDQSNTVNANKGSIVNVNTPHYADDGDRDGHTLIYLKLAIPAIFSFMIIALCCYKIVNDEQTQPELRAVYWSSLTATATAWLPSAAAIKRRG